jgi:hypothetical protein
VVREDGTLPSGLARALRDRFREGDEPGEEAGGPEGERSSRSSLRPSHPQSDPPSLQGDPHLPTVSLPPGTRDRFTTRVARYLTETDERRALLLPGIREDLALLEEAGARGVVAEAARSVLRNCPGDDPLARLLSGRS